MANYNGYPFVAIVGQEDIRKALILNVINPQIGGVLLSGEKGTGKSTLVRGLADIIRPIKLCELPLNITEDRLVGGISLQRAIQDGEKELEPGILQEADGNILYADEVNLLPEQIVNILLEVSATGKNVIEREGISTMHRSHFILIGSMNPEEGRLRSHFLDRFGLYVDVVGEKERSKRCEIIRRRIDYENNPSGFIQAWEEETNRLREQIQEAIKQMPLITVQSDHYDFAAALAEAGSCQGHRGELTLIETARAIAAFEKALLLTEAHIEEAAKFVLPHRLCDQKFIEEINECEGESGEQQQEEFESRPNDLEKNWEPMTSSGSARDQGLEQQEEILETDQQLSFSLNIKQAPKKAGTGKRVKVRSDTARGRYVRYCFPKDKPKDIAIDATIRSAALHRSESSHLCVTVKKSDIREKVREQRTGAAILFLVDASGSMGAKRRMGAVKGAIFSLLNDAYQKRDSIGMIVFRNTSAEVLLPMTRSVDLAQKKLQQLKTGGKSPLAAGLVKALDFMRIEKYKNPDTLQYLVVITDGKANIPYLTSNSSEDAMTIAEKIGHEGIQAMIIDSENGYMRYGLAEKLSHKMKATYLNLQSISTQDIKKIVIDFIHH